MWTTKIFDNKSLPLELICVDKWVGITSTSTCGYWGYGFSDQIAEDIVSALNLAYLDDDSGYDTYYFEDLNDEDNEIFQEEICVPESFCILYNSFELPVGFIKNHGNESFENVLDILNAGEK